jgi:hypothetical protein
MHAPGLDHSELIPHGHFYLSSMHSEPYRILRHSKRATIAASFDERLANDTLTYLDRCTKIITRDDRCRPRASPSSWIDQD